MKTIILATIFSLSLSPALAESTTTQRDSSGKTTGTQTKRTNSDGTKETRYRNSSGESSGTKTERKNADGSTTTTYRDSQGKTTGTKTERKSK